MGIISRDTVSAVFNQKPIEGIRCVFKGEEPEGLLRQAIFFQGAVASDPVSYRATDHENMLKAAREILEEVYLISQK